MIYHWVGKDGLAPLAAAIHLGYLPFRVKTEAELRFLLRQELPLRKGVAAREFGVLFMAGRGRKGEGVYTLATGKKPDLVLKTITKILPLLGEDPLNYHFVNCKTALDRHRKQSNAVGPRLCCWYNAIGQMVREVQRSL